MGESFCPADAGYVAELRVDFIYSWPEFDGYQAIVE
jgi:hypothetical protein